MLNMQVYRYEESEKTINDIDKPSIFLAGPTVRGNQPHLTSWRFAAIEEFEKQGFKGDLIVPEFTSKKESDKGKEWVPIWEYNGLKKADCIMFWVPRTRELIALTTNMEFGYWQAREPQKMIYGRPDDAYRMGYLDIMWKTVSFENRLYKPNIYTTLEETVSASIYMAYDNFNKTLPKHVKEAMDECKKEELSGGLGFMGSPTYFKNKEIINNFLNNKITY
jgi:nucleoside 2-deoxyribosyltransferase